jgi:thioredoxin 1
MVVARELGERRRRTANLHTRHLASGTRSARAWWPVRPRTYPRACPLVKGRRPLSDHVTNATFEQEVLRAPGPVLVDFWADWCRPCHAVAPVLERIAEERNLKLVKVDYDEKQDLAERFGIQSIPNIILFEDGAPKAQTIGAQPKSALARTRCGSLGKAGR